MSSLPPPRFIGTLEWAVAYAHGRRALGLELNPTYAARHSLDAVVR